MADAAITFLLESGAQLLKSYYELISGAEDELKKLRNELALLKAYLRQAVKKEQKEDSLIEIERQIREAIYEAEDTIDSCLTEAGVASTRNKLLRGFKSKRGTLASEVKTLRQGKVTPLLEKAEKYFANMQTGDGSAKSGDGSGKGLEDQRKNLGKKDRGKLDVISIIGMPGLGKTTLAWKIFQNENIVQFHFPVRIWVYVSQEFNRKDVLLTILKAFSKEDLPHMEYDDLVNSVRSSLENTKFLLVLDDVWTVDAWKVIQEVLPEKNVMSKVLITTRDKNVATHANVLREPHQLRFLTDQESWELLQLKVFDDDPCPPELQDTGYHIAKQCRGLPLAIVVIGGILVDQFSKAQGMLAILKSMWEDVRENVSRYFKDHVKDEDREKGTADVVALSYNKLPDALRECFLYLGVFPEDYVIPAWTLTRLWIAEGFIQRKEGESLEKTAEESLNDLITRNLVIVEGRNAIGEVKTCRVHDVIRQFCISKADEQNLFKEIKKTKEGGLHPPVSEIENYRRLCIHSNLSDFLSAGRKLKGPGVRSFLCFYRKPFAMQPKYISTIPDAFTLLRVLDYMSVKFNQFPIRVAKLIHLRYLTLSWDDLDHLPVDISELWNLQTLVIDTKSRTLNIQANIWKMIQLRHLKTKAAIKLLDIKGEGKAGENLQTLSSLSPESCKEEVFNKARNLKKLGIRGNLLNLLDAKCSLENLAFLENLKLVNDLSYELETGSSLCRLLQPNFLPPKLKRLTLTATFLPWRDMSTLGKIDGLQVLKLKDNAFTGDHWNAVSGGFRSLQFLLIASTDLEFWDASDDHDHLPSLRCLVLRSCKELGKIPLCLKKSLQILDIDHVSESAAESARKIKEEKERMPQEKGRWGKFTLNVGAGCK
ncbi:putative late blight resistance proteinR1B-16 [Sesamum alatum]|uniref:Late blight resistance proteinR1B-16 n=1 Tax=Sesamum alatum TaxID=300844 RepID=A0AAE2CXR0_9LAMI|nr:putative late blight resistance proteinR1B-16 [Sesamum alatum]